MNQKRDQYTDGIWPEPKVKTIDFDDPGEGQDASQQQSGPVTVLGMTFANDEERRQYFREELRKKLPELRHIEGFPIGEDDDIINLSDPPYYTACPNPWLNDFIAEWEQEKKRLEAEGKRKTDFVVSEPYASDVSEGKNNPVYNAHSYHTKVPHPAIMRYILHYTQPGDIVFDGFAGTGMTGVASNFCSSPENDLQGKIQEEFKIRSKSITWGERHAIQSDLSPVASLICGVYNSPRKMSALLRVENLLNQIELEYDWMYKTQTQDGDDAKINYVVWSDVFVCPHCGKELVFYDSAVNHATNVVAKEFPCPNCGATVSKNTLEKSVESVFDDVIEEVTQRQKMVPVLINYSIGRRSFDKRPDENDFAVIDKAKSLAKSFRLVKERMMEGREARRNDRQGLTHVHQFYFSRSLIILEKLLTMSNDIEMKFLVNSQLINISKLNRYRPGVSFPYNPLSGTLYIGSQISESNVFVALKNKLGKLKLLFRNLNSMNASSVSSATSINLPDNSVDYIFTDPPFGANISYSELNFIQESWLRVKTNVKHEAVVNVSHGKQREDYQYLMTLSLKEYYRILKSGHWMTVEFSNTSASIWNAIIQALENAGFIVSNVSALDKQQGSFKAVTTTTAVKQDLVISCYKPSASLLEKFDNMAGSVENAWDFIEEHLSHLAVHIEKGNQTATVIERSPKILYDRLISYYVQHGYPVPMDAREFQEGLRERYLEIDGMFFTASQAAEYEQKRKNTTGVAPMGIIVSDEANGIEWLRNFLRKTPKTYQDIQPDWMQAINGVRKNDILPELRDILEENFIEEPDGKWRLPNIQDDVDMNALRTKALLREFRSYVEMASKPKSKIKEARVEALRAGFKQCYIDKDFETIVLVSNKIPQNLLQEDEVLLQFYDIALNKI
jgi:DNA modification methylase/predicted RNA-binding Zn-ribbon protein involved in translation (DUF1610 family)